MTACDILRDMKLLAEKHGIKLEELLIPRWLADRLDIETYQALEKASGWPVTFSHVDTFHGLKIRPVDYSNMPERT